MPGATTRDDFGQFFGHVFGHVFGRVFGRVLHQVLRVARRAGSDPEDALLGRREDLERTKPRRLAPGGDRLHARMTPSVVRGIHSVLAGRPWHRLRRLQARHAFASHHPDDRAAAPLLPPGFAASPHDVDPPLERLPAPNALGRRRRPRIFVA